MDNREINDKQKEFYDAMWNEVEQPHQSNTSEDSYNTRPTLTKTNANMSYRSKTTMVNAACPQCNYVARVSVSKRSLNSFSYKCPNCGRKVSIQTTRSGANALTLGIIVFVVVVIAFLVFYFVTKGGI